MTERLKVGIAGYGIVGQRRRAVIDQHPSLRVVAVCDRTYPKPGTLDDGTRYYPTYQQLLAEPLDVLFVSMSNDMAAEVTIAALDKSLHVFCEKPPARNLDEMGRVLAAEKRHPKLRLAYGFNHRYHDSIKDALRIVRSGELGAVLNLRGVYGKSKMLNWVSDWRTERAIAGGGILLDQGIHMVDMLRLFAGEFTDIHSFVSNKFWKHDVEDNVYALMRTGDGVVALLHSSATQWRHRFHLEIALERGTIVLEGILSGTKSYGAETITVAYASKEDGGDPLERRTRYNEDRSWRDETFEFADAVTSGAQITNGSSHEAWKTLELVYRIYCADPEWKQQFRLNDRITESS